MTDLGEIKYFLSLEIEQRKAEIFIHQRKYAADMLKKYKMKDYNGISTPMENQLKLKSTRIGEEFDSSLYRSMIGSLMYLCASRPDIVCSVNIVTGGNRELIVFRNASYAMGENCRSRSGYCCSFGSGIFSWNSRNQAVVAQSIAEAEFISVNHAARQAV
ncbi:uncharacterized mitochondrial protein AtMg00810-like [Rutidosis leptorrhynchoides]|uniref:uncharacterized mitochondrial protein AtMg00810-like n=1 Tax=Rutidosis leptorrhynchoides TaxID=125765 RepID=UPI003A98F9A8